MSPLGFGSWKGTSDNPMPQRPAIKVGDTVRHTRFKRSGVYWQGEVVRHDGFIAIKWAHLHTPALLSDYGYNDIRAC